MCSITRKKTRFFKDIKWDTRLTLLDIRPALDPFRSYSIFQVSAKFSHVQCFLAVFVFPTFLFYPFMHMWCVFVLTNSSVLHEITSVLSLLHRFLDNIK